MRRTEPEEARGAADDAIARKIEAGDPRAFDAFFERYAGPLAGHLCGMVRNRATAEDLLQETMVRVYSHIGRYRERGAFRAWVYRIATNLALTELRRSRIRRECALGTPAEEPACEAPDPEERLERAEAKDAVRRGISALPDEQRAVVLLRVRREMGIREIARTLSIPEGTVKSRLHHAVRSLRAYMKERETPHLPEEND